MMDSMVLYKSFDARVWAKAFIEAYVHDSGIATDQGAMTAWFTGALMRGYDEHYWRSKEYKRHMRSVLVPWYKRWFVSLDKFGH